MIYNKEDMEKVLNIALGRGGDFAEIYVERRTVNSCSTEEAKMEDVSFGIVGGVGIRLIDDDKTYYAYTSDFSLESLEQCAETLSKALKKEKKARKILLTKLRTAVVNPELVYPDQVSMSEKVALLQKLDRFCWASDTRVSQVKVLYGDVVQSIAVANSLGELIEDERVRTKLVVQVIASDQDGQIQSGYDAMGGSVGFELFREADPFSVAKNAVHRALLMLEAKLAPAGKMVVIMSSEAGGTMVHEACGHGLEADLVEKGLSVYAGKIGQQVASPLVTVVDDGTMIGKYGTTQYDDEGVPCQKNVLIEHGILKAYMTDRLTAEKMNIPLTGNGRRESYKHKPVTRMTNTYIAPGQDDPAEMIREIKRGFFAKKMGGGQVNTVNGDFVFEVSEGYLIENGKVTTPVKGATLTGNGPEVLKMIDRVGQDLGYSIGTCGKDGQGVPVADAQPTIRIPELIVGGIVEE